MNVILVATWFPAVDDPARGRFVADQAAALAGTDEARPLVISFDPMVADPWLNVRAEDRLAIGRVAATAWTSGQDPFSRRGYGSAFDVPVARLTIPDGEVLPPGADGDLRRDALDTFATTVLPRLHLGPGVVHAHTAYPDGYAAAALAQRLGWPLVVTEHASFVDRQLRNPGVRRRYLAAVAAADRFIAVSPFLAGELEAAIPELAGAIEVVPNLIHLEDFPLSEGERHTDELLFVGYRKASKGMAVLLQAFAAVRKARPGATLRLVGRSSTPFEEHGWHRLAAELGVADGVSFDAPADRAGVASALAQASLFVHPSPRETFGITTLEALASGLPVVATRSGGISGMLEDRSLGELVPAGDPEALAAAVLRSLDRRTEFDPAHLRAAVLPYGASSVAGRLVDIYRDLLATSARPLDPPGTPSDGGTLGGSGTEQGVRHFVAVATDERAAGRVESLPDAVRERIELVRVEWRAARRPPARGLSVPGRLGRRMRRIRERSTASWRQVWARNPVGVGRRRRARIAAQERLASHLTPSTGVLPLDATSAWILEPLVVDGRATALPGGLLWLADRSWSDQPAASPSRERISDASRSPTTDQS
jgi:glycosyltransferase involved in cell wall biosynthesis